MDDASKRLYLLSTNEPVIKYLTLLWHNKKKREEKPMAKALIAGRSEAKRMRDRRNRFMRNAQCARCSRERLLLN